MNSYKAHMKKETRQTGFTLVELLVTMAVMIIALAIGVPAYNGMIENNRAIAQTNLIVTAINAAKSRAIVENETVTLCGIDDTATPSSMVCADTAAEWKNGWFMYKDYPTINTSADKFIYGDFDSGDELLRFWGTYEGSSWIQLEGNPSITLQDAGGTAFSSFIFISNGEVNTQAKSSPSQDFEFPYQVELDYPDANSSQTRCITVNGYGLISLQRGGC